MVFTPEAVPDSTTARMWSKGLHGGVRRRLEALLEGCKLTLDGCDFHGTKSRSGSVLDVTTFTQVITDYGKPLLCFMRNKMVQINIFWFNLAEVILIYNLQSSY